MTLPSCLEDDYTILKRYNTQTYLVARKGEPSVIKIFPPEKMSQFQREKEAFLRLNGLGVTPEYYDIGICENMGFISMEPYDYTLDHLLPQLTSAQKRIIADQINHQVEIMHEQNLAHGDLHTSNIVVSLNPIRTAIIDFEYSFDIDTGARNPRVQRWMQEGFDWESDYPAFVEYDYNNWYSTMLEG